MKNLQVLIMVGSFAAGLLIGITAKDTIVQTAYHKCLEMYSTELDVGRCEWMLTH